MTTDRTSERDRLAADLMRIGVATENVSSIGDADQWVPDLEAADRLIALGWTRLDEERLARALKAWGWLNGETTKDYGDDAAAIAEAYREAEPEHMEPATPPAGHGGAT